MTNRKHYLMSFFVSGIVFLFGVLDAGCTEKSHYGPYALPTYGGLGSCVEQSKVPEPCVWALSADAVMVGTIKVVRAVESPARVALTNADPAIVDRCDGAVNPALRIDLTVEKVIQGSVEGTSLPAFVGAIQVSLFVPRPALKNGDTVWVAADHQTIVPGIGPGQRLLLALHFNKEHSVWSVMGEPMAEVKANDSGGVEVVFQEVFDSCGILPPAVPAGSSYDDFASLIASCDQATFKQAADQRRLLVENAWGQTEDWYFAATCIPKDQGKQPECSSDRDCDFGLLCIDGRCQQP